MIKSKQSKSSTSQINPHEFDGLASFEVISSYKVFQEVKRSGKQSYKLEEYEPGKKVKRKKINLQKEDSECLTKTSANVQKRKTAKKRKNEESKESENPLQKKVALNVDVEAWRAIFTPECVIEAIKGLGFQEPTPIQKLTIPAAISAGKDIIGAAETGSGKTLAFIIPIIHGILMEREAEAHAEDANDPDMKAMDSESEDKSDNDTEILPEGTGCVKVINDVTFDFPTGEDCNTKTYYSDNKLRALVVTPTRELAVQIKKHTDAILTKTDIMTAVVIGGLSQEKQERVLRKGPEIVIGTPGRLWEMVHQGNPHLSRLPDISFLVVDETDRMLERGHFEELQQLLELINANEKARSRRQTFVFSATLTLTHEPPKRLKTKKQVFKMTSEMKIENVTKLIGVRYKPKIVDITRKSGTAEGLSEAKIICSKEEKDSYLYYFLSRFPGRTLVFCNSINCVRRLTNLLTILQCKPWALHASKQQKQRLKSLERFAANKNCVLLATDVAARGLDIPGVNHIFHYEVPQTAETYVHRSGRTARACNEGLSVLLVDSTEASKYRQFWVTLNRSSDLPDFPVEADLFMQVKERVDLGREVESMVHRDDMKKKDHTWLRNMAEEAGIEIDNSDTDDDNDDAYEIDFERKKRNHALEARKFRLSTLLSLPLTPTSFSGKFPTSTGKLLIPGVLTKATPTPNAAIVVLKEGRGKELPKLSSSRIKKKFKRKVKKNKKERD